jgi:hypothetical protein
MELFANRKATLADGLSTFGLPPLKTGRMRNTTFADLTPLSKLFTKPFTKLCQTLDPFCGCGTTIDAAEKLGRDWIGIDVTQLAISLIKNRLQDTYGRRLKFVSGSAASAERGVHAAATPEREAASKRAEARAPEGRAGSPLPAAERGESSARQQPFDGAHGVTRPTESLVRIIGELGV